MRHLDVLKDRARYLAARVEAKKSVGWEYEYDARERAALAWAIEQIERPGLSAADTASA